jgi:anti-anti-sigma factor
MDISPSIEVDLRATTFMDSSGLAALIQAHRQAPETLVLIDPSKPVRRILTLSGVDTLFPISAS